MSIIFHIDVNSAFLSWTASRRLQEDPASVDLRTIPSIIGGDEKQRHGVVLAKSIPAKRYGIHTGEPVATALAEMSVSYAGSSGSCTLPYTQSGTDDTFAHIHI